MSLQPSRFFFTHPLMLTASRSVKSRSKVLILGFFTFLICHCLLHCICCCRRHCPSICLPCRQFIFFVVYPIIFSDCSSFPYVVLATDFSVRPYVFSVVFSIRRLFVVIPSLSLTVRLFHRLLRQSSSSFVFPIHSTLPSSSLIFLGSTVVSFGSVVVISHTKYICNDC